MVEKFSPASLPSVLPDNEKAGFGPIQLQKTALLFDLLDMLDPADVVESENPLSMESVGQVCKHLQPCLYVSFFPHLITIQDC